MSYHLISQVILKGMIKVLGGAHGVATSVLNGAYNPIDQYKQCGNERRDDYDDKPQGILGRILLSEDLGSRKVACQAQLVFMQGQCDETNIPSE